MRYIYALMVAASIFAGCAHDINRTTKKTIYLMAQMTPTNELAVPFTGVCPECQRMGLKSKIYVSGGYATLLGWEPFYDEAGNYHSHDPNVHISYITCTHGHRYMRRIELGCSCSVKCAYKGSDVLIRIKGDPQ